MSKNTINLLTIFWFLKFIFDMFYMQKFFTVFITIFAVMLLLLCFKNNKFKFKKVDLMVVILILLFSLSFFKSTEFYIDYLKIISAFLLYFLGRLLYLEEPNVEKTIYKSLFIVFIINLIVCLVGNGNLMWGKADTLKGMYYFKTDFACMLAYFLLFWLFNYNKNILYKILMIIIVLALILLANARIYYMIAALILIMYYAFYTRNKKIFSIKTILSILIGIIIIIVGIQAMSNLSIFKERNLISLNISSFEDLFNSSNTQGRNVVWDTLIHNFNNQSITTRTFGAGLSFYLDYGYKGYTEHSTYVKVLLNTGYVGLTIFILFIICLFKSISSIDDRKLEYVSFLLLIIFLISGISSPTILYVNTSWLPMFYAGVCISHENKKIRGELNEK